MFTKHVQILQNLRGQVPDDLISVLQMLLGNCSQDLVTRGTLGAIVDGENADKPNLEPTPIVPFTTLDPVYAALFGYNPQSYLQPDIQDGVVNQFAGDFKGVVRIQLCAAIPPNQAANIALVIVNHLGGAGGIWANVGDANNYVEQVYTDNLTTNKLTIINTGFGNGTASGDSSGSGPYSMTNFYYTSGTAAPSVTLFTNPRGHVWRLGDSVFLGYNGQTQNWEVIDVTLHPTNIQTSNSVDTSAKKLQYTVKSYQMETTGSELGLTTDYHTGASCP